MNGRIKAYLYSAISSTFLFVIMREIGFIGHRNTVQFGDQPTRIFGAPILGANSKFLNDAITTRGVKSKKILNEAMINAKAKASDVARSKATKTTTSSSEPDDEFSSKRHLRRQPRNGGGGGRTSSREHDSNRDERNEVESDEKEEADRHPADRHPADRRSKSSSTTSSSRRDGGERTKRTSRRDRDNYEEKESSSGYNEERNDEDTGSVSQQTEDFDRVEEGDSSSSRRRSNARTLTSGGNDVDEEAEVVDHQTKKHKRQPAYDADNANDAVGDHNNNGGRKRNEANYENDAAEEGAGYKNDKGNVGHRGGKSGLKSRASLSKSAYSTDAASVTDAEVTATTDTIASTKKNRGYSKPKPIDGDNVEEAGANDAASNAKGADRRGKPKGILPPLESDGDAAVISNSSPAEPQSQPAAEEGTFAGQDEVRQQPPSSGTYTGQNEIQQQSLSSGTTYTGQDETRQQLPSSKISSTYSDTSVSSPSVDGKGYNQDSVEPAPLAAADESSSLEKQPIKKGAPLLQMEKPSIYTFFTGVKDRTANTGMTDDADNQLLQTWKEEWSNAGWNPVILSLETAKKHPDFEAVDALLDGPFGEYDRYCFLRWLAVAVVGGGFAVDYDTLPFNFVMNTLPNGGKVTVHENSEAGGVPSLVSASADEYTKFAWALAKNLGSHKTEEHWSDMKAMQDLYQKSNGKAYIMESNVISALEVLNGRGYDPYNCGIVEGKYAIHFSHHAIKFGKLWDGVGPQDRPKIGKEWLKGWRKSCKWRISSELS